MLILLEYSMTTDNIQPLIYKSTRGQAKELYFKDVIFEGLASDGGLYIPSVWPKLEIFRSFGGDSFSYLVTNNGTGPALIKYVTIKNDSTYIKMWKEIDAFKNIRQSHISNRTLSPQNSITPVSY